MQSDNMKSASKVVMILTAFYDYTLARLKMVSARVKIWQENRRGRYYLSEMSEHLLKDIGISEEERQEELRKKFWQ